MVSFASEIWTNSTNMSTRSSSSIFWGDLALVLHGRNDCLLVSPWPVSPFWLMVVHRVSLVALGASVKETLSWFNSSWCSWRSLVGCYPELCLGVIYLDTGYTTIMLLLEVSHLFPDDTLIMCDVDLDQIHNLRHILLRFEAIFAWRSIFKNWNWSQWGRYHIRKSWLIFVSIYIFVGLEIFGTSTRSLF